MWRRLPGSKQRRKTESYLQLLTRTHTLGAHSLHLMALSFSQSLSLSTSHRSLLHGNPPFSPQIQRIHTSKDSTYLLKFPSIRCSSGFNDKTSFTLQTCKNCKTQFDPALNHPLACRFHTAHFGGSVHFYTPLFNFVVILVFGFFPPLLV